VTETVVILDMMNPARADKLRELLPAGMVLTHGTERTEEHRCAIIAEADYAITGQVEVTAPVLRAAKRLKLLHKWGVGVDNIDLETAKACGIAVARTTASNAVAVAEHTLGLMLAALRNIGYGHAELREGRWACSPARPSASWASAPSAATSPACSPASAAKSSTTNPRPSRPPRNRPSACPTPPSPRCCPSSMSSRSTARWSPPPRT
jgi:hypothetical protein